MVVEGSQEVLITVKIDFAEWIEPLLFEFPTAGILHLCNAGVCSSWKDAVRTYVRTKYFRGK
jgi:hypothetical protein